MVPSQRGCGWLSSRDVYVKTTTRRNTDGTAVRYLHLAHNEWDPTAGRSVPKILHSFGREDHLDRSAITRLVTSLSKLLDPADALAATAASELAFVESRPYGGGNGDGDGDGDGKMAGFRTYGKSKDHRPDLPQVVIGMAVTRTGIPVRVWCWPGNTGDSALIRQVKSDMRDWTLTRIVWVADRGFASEANRRYLRSG